MIKRILLLVMPLLMCFGCNSVLDIKPDKYALSTESYYKTAQQLDIALRGVYAILAETNLYGNIMMGRMGLEADEGFGNSPSENGTVTYYAVNTTDVKILNHWRWLYRGISRANLLLQNVDSPEISIEQTDRDQIKGQALFLRGYYYFLLVNKFGGVPIVLTPPVSSEAEEIQQPRATMKEVYEQVLSDMKQSADLVADITSVKSGGRISKSTVWGMLARVCLYMAGEPLKETARYTEAAEWSHMVMDISYHKLNPSYKQVFINYAQDLYDTKESIWEVEFWGNGTGVYGTTGGMVGVNYGIAYPATGKAGFGFSSGLVRPTKWLFDLYDAGDLRRDWVVAPYRYLNDTISNWSTVTWATVYDKFCGKFRRESETMTPKSSSQTPQNFPLLRYADVLLMYAEAINESAGVPSDKAHEALNKIRRRARGVDPEVPNAQIDLSGLSYAAFQEQIKNERARELCFETLRKNDLVRWGDFYKNMKARYPEVPAGTNSAYVSGRTYFENVAERDVIWPIPAYEIGVNTKLIQNEGW